MVYEFSTDQPLYVSEGDYVQFKFKAPPDWNTTETITIQIGDLLQYWSLITIPLDYTPDPYPFIDIDDADRSTMYVWADGSRPAETMTTVTGLTDTTTTIVSLTSNIGSTIDDYSLRLDYDGDGTWDTDWIHTNDGTTIGNNGRIQIRGKTSSFINAPLELSLRIGTSIEKWKITTLGLPQNKPEPFPDYTDLIDQPTNTYCYSEVIRVQGLTSLAPINVTGGDYGISSSNTTFTDDNGFEVLADTLFTNTSGSINNGDYLQLRVLSSSVGLSPEAVGLSIGDVSGGETWSVTTGSNPSLTPGTFNFTDIPDAIEDFLQPSDQQPVDGLSGLGTPVQVTLVDEQTTASEVKIKINDNSIGVFPATVDNGDKITIYAKSSATFGDNVTATIKVGARQIPTWTVITNTGPDTDATFVPPLDRINQVPNTYVSSAPVTISGINRPITIEVLSGYDALISIDYDTPVTGPRTFDPRINTSFYLVILSNPNTNSPEFTEVSVGTGSSNNPFTWTVTTYNVAPPSAAQLGLWYSKKTEKFDGYQVGTVIPILKQTIASSSLDSYGNLGGDLGSRYPGFIECKGQSLDAQQYGPLFDVIGNNYGGNGIKNITDTGVISYTGSFNLPDYRNRRLCGVGSVDSSRGNSAFLPVASLGDGITDVGAQGGFWYFDKVDSFGILPLEQIQGPSTSTSGLNSQFFSLGTVRLEGLDTITDSITFSVNGNVNALIGPLNSVIVSVPQHNHGFISAVVEGDGGDPLIAWHPQRALMGVGNLSHPGGYVANNTITDNDVISAWSTWLTSTPSANNQNNFDAELRQYYGGNFDLNTWIEENLPYGLQDNTNNNTTPPEFGEIQNDLGYGTPLNTTDISVDFLVWWVSPKSALSGIIPEDGVENPKLLRTNATNPVTALGAAEHSAVIDTEPTTFRIEPYRPYTDTTYTHSHYISNDAIPNPQTDFSGGNVSGPGVLGGDFGSGLGQGTPGAILTFRLWNRRTEFGQMPLNPDGTRGAYINRGIGEWAYRISGGPDNNDPGYWTSVDNVAIIEGDLIYSVFHVGPQTGSGARIKMTAMPHPSVNGNYPYGDTKYKIDEILDIGQGYQVGDKLTLAWWNNLDDTGDRMIEVTGVGTESATGAGELISVNFSQSDVFMDVTNGFFEFTSSYKKPTPTVTMRPQRQVPIINPFHKTKYIIKAY